MNWIEIIIYIISGIAAGAGLGIAFAERKKGKEIRLLEIQANEERLKREGIERQLADERNNFAAEIRREQSIFAERIESERKSAAAILEAEKRSAAEKLALERRNNENALKSERENNSKLLEELEKKYTTALEGMKSEMKVLSGDILKQRSEELKKNNIEQIGTILNPIREQMESVRKSVQEVNKESIANKASMEEKIKNLIEETSKVGLQADNLAKALKGNSKLQGDWGEQLLASILENSGLREGLEYRIQENVKDENNNNLRPDVIVNCPGEKQIIIDSKVSLTAYVDYVNAQSEADQERYQKANMDSIRKHIDELAAKNYPATMPKALSHVLMFVPNEGSYVLALRSDPNIGSYAFKKNVLLINATNLMMALQLIYNLWQTEKQTRNLEKIVKESNGLYEKFATFLESWDKIKSGFATLSKNIETTDKQLCSGPGNVVKRIVELRRLGGLLPKKEIGAHYIRESEQEEIS